MYYLSILCLFMSIYSSQSYNTLCLSYLQVTSSDETLIKVLAPERTAHLDYLASYPVVLELSSSLWARSQLEAVIDVRCIATGQRQTIGVKIKLHGEQGTQVQQGK